MLMYGRREIDNFGCPTEDRLDCFVGLIAMDRCPVDVQNLSFLVVLLPVLFYHGLDELGTMSSELISTSTSSYQHNQHKQYLVNTTGAESGIGYIPSLCLMMESTFTPYKMLHITNTE